MENIFLFTLFYLTSLFVLQAQDRTQDTRQKQNISALIDKYAEAREKSDTVLLKSILSNSVDQLVSSGEWRTGVASSVQGMLRSSANNSGTRTLKIERLRFINLDCAIVDCKYEIQSSNGSKRSMWSTFIVASENGIWKISAIRNMLPAGN